MSWIDEKPQVPPGMEGKPMGWHVDPENPDDGQERWWNGRQWTESYRKAEK